VLRAAAVVAVDTLQAQAVIHLAVQVAAVRAVKQVLALVQAQQTRVAVVAVAAHPMALQAVQAW
jgi:hypothetical protein